MTLRTSANGAHIVMANEKPMMEINIVAPNTLEVKLKQVRQ
jgi:hypothetical protein